VRENERGAAELFDELGHGEGLAGTGDTEENLMLFAVEETAGKFLDCRLLIAFGRVGYGELEGHESSIRRWGGGVISGGSGDFEYVHYMRRFRNRITVFAHGTQMEFYRILYQLSGFFQGETERYAARQIGDVGTPAVGRLFVNDGIFHFLSAACFRIDDKVPGGISMPA